jgi:hypothetical protein
MTSRLLLSAVLATPIVRRHRRDDGRLFGVATLRDADRGEVRTWTVFVNDVSLIEKFEALRAGEPIAISGPFNVTADDARLVFRITADALVSGRKQRKKRSISTEIPDADPSDAPKDDEAGEGPFNDPLPF